MLDAYTDQESVECIPVGHLKLYTLPKDGLALPSDSCVRVEMMDLLLFLKL